MPEFLSSRRFNKNPSRRYVGVELEFFYPSRAKGFMTQELKQYGEIGLDSSIEFDQEEYRNEMITKEFRSHPAHGDRLIKNIKDICKILRMYKAMVNETCGLHVHVDFRNQSAKKIMQSCQWFQIFESVFMSMVDGSRTDNDFCGSVQWNNYESLKYLNRVCPGCSNLVNASDCTCPNGDIFDKYQSLSLNRLDDLRTLEIRLHEGNIKFTEISGWVKFLSSFFDHFSEKEIDRTMKSRFVTLSYQDKLEYLFNFMPMSESVKKYVLRKIKKANRSKCRVSKVEFDESRLIKKKMKRKKKVKRG